MDHSFAMRIWHWTFLAQKYPLPEMLIEKAPVEYLDYKMASWTKAKDLSAFDPRALAHYHAFFSDPLRIHATCEDYRAGETTDLAHDEVDHAARNKISTPLFVLWGAAAAVYGFCLVLWLLNQLNFWAFLLVLLAIQLARSRSDHVVVHLR